MQTFVEFAPWIIFGLVYKFAGGLYPATAVLMVCMALLLLYAALLIHMRRALPDTR